MPKYFANLAELLYSESLASFIIIESKWGLIEGLTRHEFERRERIQNKAIARNMRRLDAVIAQLTS